MGVAGCAGARSPSFAAAARGASELSIQGPSPASINPAGAITGYYVDVNFVGHGFLRATNGTLTTFDAPGAGTTGFLQQGTAPASINPAGAIMGLYIDANTGRHGFLLLRKPGCKITQIGRAPARERL